VLHFGTGKPLFQANHSERSIDYADKAGDLTGTPLISLSNCLLLLPAAKRKKSGKTLNALLEF